MSKRLRTPTILQLDAAECGAASLAMVLGYYGRHVPLDELRVLCGVSRDGSKASNIVRAGRHLGLDGKGLKAEPEHLKDQRFPLIAFVNFNHFLVVEWIDDKQASINDPANGRRRETFEEFSKAFTGVILTFEPNSEFKKGDERPSLLKSLARRLQSVKQALWFVFLTSLVLVIPGIAIPVFSRIFVDYILIRSLDGWLVPLLIGMAATAIARFGLLELEKHMLIQARLGMSLETGRSFMRKLLTLPISFFDQRFAGEIASRVQLNEALARLLTGRLAEAAVALVSTIFFGLTLLFYNWQLTIAVLFMALLNGAVLIFSNRMLSDSYRKLSIDLGKLSGARVAGLKDMETFKASGAEDMLFNRWTGLSIVSQNSEQRANAIKAWIEPLPILIGSLSTVIILIWGGYFVMAGGMTLGSLVGYQSLATSFIAPVIALASFGAEFQEVRANTARLDDVLGQKSDLRFSSELRPTETDIPDGSVELRGVNFGYSKLDAPMIKNLSLELRSGQRVALVGPSGSGKSTIGKLIAGLEHPNGGTILIGGRPILEWPRAVLAVRLAYVRQDVCLFEGTVRDNLTMWDDSIAEPDIIAAAKDARIHDVISARRGSYNAEIKESGNNFSGGEKQRIEIARALAANPSIVVLDEATSALDPVNEHLVMEAIRRRGATCIVIAHRLSAIRDCDEIIVLDRGQVVERGDHESLLRSDGYYSRLLTA